MQLSDLLTKYRIWWRVGVPILLGGTALTLISWASSGRLISRPTIELLRIPSWLMMFSPLLFVVRDYSHWRPIRVVVWTVMALVLVWRIFSWTDELQSLAAVPLLGSESDIQPVLMQVLVTVLTATSLFVPLMLCEELIAQSREHQLLLDNTPALIARCDRNKRYLAANKRYEEWFDKPVSQVVGSHVWDVIGPESWHQVEHEHAAVLRSGRPRVFESHFKHQTPPRWVRVHLQPHGGDKEVQSYYAMILDITEAKRAEMEVESERKLLRRVLEVQERERRASALDLHDGMIQYCVGAKMLVDACRAELGHTQLDRASEHLQMAIREGRRMVGEWRHPILEESGLEEAVRHRAAEVQRTSGVAVTTNFAVDFEIPAALKDSVYRIVHEALTNVGRHSGAPRATVNLRHVQGELQLHVCDCGRGFDREQVASERFGLVGIEERARLLGGKASIESTPGVGTQVSVSIPCGGAKPTHTENGTAEAT